MERVERRLDKDRVARAISAPLELEIDHELGPPEGRQADLGASKLGRKQWRKPSLEGFHGVL